MQKRITKATFKSFLKRNAGKLEIRNLSHFNGMSDGVEQLDNNGYRPLIAKTFRSIAECDLGLDGIWLTHTAGDNRFSDYQNGRGIEVYNCVGSYIVRLMD